MTRRSPTFPGLRRRKIGDLVYGHSPWIQVTQQVSVRIIANKGTATHR